MYSVELRMWRSDLASRYNPVYEALCFRLD
jgi:hypothetical protein